MQVLRLLAAARRRQRRAVSTITAAHHSEVPDTSEAGEEDDGPFFDLDFSSSSVRASSSASSSSASESDDACSDLDFIISLRRSRTASPSYSYSHHEPTLNLIFPPPLELTKRGGNRSILRSTPRSFGASINSNKAASFYGGRPSFASSARSLRLFMESPTTEDDDDASEPAHHNKRGAPSGDVIRRYLTKISRRLRRSVRAGGDSRPRGAGIHHPQHRRLRKSRSASAAVVSHSLPSARRDDSVIEKQDGIASAIAHCKESFHRASLSECDSSLLRSRSDPGKCA